MSPTTIPGNLIIQSPAANDPLLDLNTQPSLDLQFATSKTLDDRVSGQNLITFSRSTTGTYVDSNGIIQTAAIDAPRFDHDPTTNASLGLLVEESRTNLLTYSEEFDNNSAWVRYLDVTVTQDTTTSPAGTTTADSLTANVNSGSIWQNFSFATNTTYTGTIYAKPNGRNFIRLRGFFSNSIDQIFDLSSGSPGVSSNNTGNALVPTIDPVGNGWYRCRVTFTTPASATSGNFSFTSEGANSLTYVSGDNTTGCYIWGAQLEAGSFATSYIPTSGSTVTRAADVASITGSNFSRWYNQSEGTFFANFTAYGRTGAGRIVGTNTGTTPMYLATDTIVRSFGNVVGASVTVPSVFNIQKAATGYEVSSQQDTLVVDGGTPNTSTNSGSFAGFDATTTTSIQLFSYPAASSYTSGTISRLTYFPERLPDATLQAITS